MRSNIRLHFRDVASDNVHDSFPGLTLAIRTDADAATEEIKSHIFDSLVQSDPANSNTEGHDFLKRRICRSIHDFYRDWGHDVLVAMADCLDYARYGLHEEERRAVHVEFFNSRALAEATIAKADKLIAQSGLYHNDQALYITLDDLITKPVAIDDTQWAEFAFSRMFSIADAQQLGYTARPGFSTVEEQMDVVRDKILALHQKTGRVVPVVLLEDNVRHAKMLNWVFKNFGDDLPCEIACISSAFCCAPASERALIAYKNNTVPLTAVIEYQQADIDVVTPRDLLFDGFVVEVDGKKTRLPALFTDLVKMFKIAPDHDECFRDRVLRSSIKFCDDIENEFGVKPLMGWFAGAEAIKSVTGKSPETPMIDILRSMRNSGPCPAPGTKPAPVPV